MDSFFNINYEFDRDKVLSVIQTSLASDESGYVCVTDGNILQMVHRDLSYRAVINGSLLSLCDSSWVPLYLRWIYGMHVPQYTGSQIFDDLLRRDGLRMYFLGSEKRILDALREKLSERYGEQIRGMQFDELPFCDVDSFDYPGIAQRIDSDGADIIWVSLGAPKQEIFMSRLCPYLKRGVVIAIGATFKFYSGVAERRAPDWMLRNHLEWLFRILMDPKKQLRRCWSIVMSLPAVLSSEWRRAWKRAGEREK